jgi:4-hydroxybenzoyl-CoA thioesterase
MPESEKRFRVEWGDCDPADIVFYPRYLEWCDACTTALFGAASLPLTELFKAHGVIGIPMVKLNARFLGPSTFGDELVARSGVLEWGTSSFVLRHQFFNREKLVVEVLETRVWTGHDPHDPQRMKSRPIPEEVLKRLAAVRVAAEEKARI